MTTTKRQKRTRPPAKRPEPTADPPHYPPHCNSHGLYTSGFEDVLVVATGAVTARVRLVCDPRLGETPWRAGLEVKGPGIAAHTDVSRSRPPHRTRADALLKTIARMRQILAHHRKHNAGKIARAAATRAVAELEEFRRAQAQADEKTPPHLVGELSGALAAANGRTADTSGQRSGATGKGSAARQHDSDIFVLRGHLGMRPAVENWLKKRGVPKREVDLYEIVLPRRQKGTISLAEWRRRCQEFLQRYLDVGWTAAGSGKEYLLERAIDGVPIGINFGPCGLSSFAVRRDDREFFSETGYRHFGCLGLAPKFAPAEVEKRLRRELAEHRASQAKHSRKTSARPGTAIVPVPAAPATEAVPAAKPLSAAEHKQLTRDEQTIYAAARSFRDAGNALARIRDKQLHRETDPTFDGYCLRKFGFRRSYAYRLIAAAAVMEQLSPIGDKLHWVPQNEAQARPLAQLEPEDRVEVVRSIVQAAPKGDDGQPRVTEQIVAEQVRRYRTPPEDLERRPKRRAERDAGQAAAIAQPPVDPEGECNWPAAPAQPAVGDRLWVGDRLCPILRVCPIRPPVVPDAVEGDWACWNGQEVEWAIALHRLCQCVRALCDRYKSEPEFRRDLAGLLRTHAEDLEA